MRILVHEFVTGGGLAGREVPASLADEGTAMVAALVQDLAAIGGHCIVTTMDSRFSPDLPTGVELEVVSADAAARIDELAAAVDAVWLIAPETARCLERVTRRIERVGTRVLGSSATAIRRASDKAALPRRLANCGVRHPLTRVVRRGNEIGRVAQEIGYPLVVKPSRGAGCLGVCLARDEGELPRAIDLARASSDMFVAPGFERTLGPTRAGLHDHGAVRGEAEALLLQRYETGTSASVSLLADGHRAVALSLNSQDVRPAQPFAYRGGETPLDHPLASQAFDAALRACRAFPGLRGFVGVDLVLTESAAVVIEVNARLTTAYLGVRAALAENVAALALEACDGRLQEFRQP